MQRQGAGDRPDLPRKQWPMFEFYTCVSVCMCDVLCPAQRMVHEWKLPDHHRHSLHHPPIGPDETPGYDALPQ